MKYIYILLFFPALAFSQQRFYVHANATGGNTGTSWADAYPDLHSALQKAAKGDTVWVARGIYRPDTATDRRRSFVLPSGVVMFGGFRGTETTVAQRDVARNIATLSGDIGQHEDSTDNSYTILYMENPDSTTVLDGFTLEHGNADYKGTDAPFRAREKCGGALYIMARDGWAYPEIRRCTFQYNSAYVHGGAVFVNGTGLGSVAPRFTHCVFRYNQARVNGGGLYKDGASWTERASDIAHCQFLSNTAGYNGGGFYFTDAERTDHPQIEYCTFTGNRAVTLAGGGFSMDLGRKDGSGGPRIFGCTFVNNVNTKAESYYVDNTYSLPIHTFEVDSCVFKGRDSTSILFSSGSLYQTICKVDRCFFERCGGVSFTDADTMIINRCNFVPSPYPSRFRLGIVTSLYTILKNSYVKRGSNELGSTRKISIFNSIIESTSSKDCVVNLENMYNSIIIAGRLNTIIIPISIKNSILIDTDGGGFLGRKTSIDHSFVRMDCAASGIVCDNGNNLIGIDPLFRDTANGDYTLLPCSPLINAGDNSAAAGLPTDLAGNPRIQSGRVDIGPYEMPVFAAGPDPGVQAACAGTPNGRVSLRPLHGCPPYTYRWRSDTGQEGSDTSALAPGQYVFTLTDARGYTAFDTLTVPESPRPTPALVPEDVLCGSSTGGTLRANLPAGVPAPVRYRWSDQPAANTPLREDLLPGRYALTVTDALGCQDSAAATLARVGNLAFAAGGTPISCHGRADGTLWVQPANGKPPYKYAWNTGAQDSLLTGVAPQTYSVTLTDALGCTATFPFFIKEPDSLRFFAEVQDATDSVSANGSIAIQRVEGGTQPYRYAWSTGSTDARVEQLRAGTYTAVVRDSAGCESVQRFVVRWLVGTEEAVGSSRRALLIWPNPAWGVVQVSGGVEHGAADQGIGSAGVGSTGAGGSTNGGTQRLRLWDGQGRLVLETAFSTGSGEVWQCAFDLSALPAGVYVAETADGQRGRVVKL